MTDGDKSEIASSLDVVSIIKKEFNSPERVYFPLEIRSCNGSRHKDFSKARVTYTHVEDECDVELCELKTLFPGVHTVMDQFPNISAQQKAAVVCLEEYIKGYECHEESLKKIGFNRDSSETDVCAVLAVHLFSKLIPNGQVIVNKDMKKLTKECSCGCKTVVKSGDTGIGNKNIWHGHPDLLVNQTAVIVRTVFEDEEEEEDEQYESVESHPLNNKKIKMEPENQHGYTVDVKTRTCDIFDEDLFSQLTSQAITNGFAQKSRLNLTNQLIPAVLCTVDDMMILLYDPDNDILLRRLESINLIVNDRLSVHALIELWLILNLHLFQPFLLKSACDAMVKSGIKAFFAKKNVLKLYEKSLVGVSQKEFYSQQLSVLNPQYIKNRNITSWMKNYPACVSETPIT